MKDRVFRPYAEADRRAEQRPARQRSSLEGVPRRPQDERPERHHANVVVELERPIGRVGRAEPRQQGDEACRSSVDAADVQRDQRECAATESQRDREQDKIAPRSGRRGDAAEPRRQRRMAQIGELPFPAVDHAFGDVGVDRPFEQRGQRCPDADLHDDQRGGRPSRGRRGVASLERGGEGAALSVNGGSLCWRTRRSGRRRARNSGAGTGEQGDASPERDFDSWRA